METTCHHLDGLVTAMCLLISTALNTTLLLSWAILQEQKNHNRVEAFVLCIWRFPSFVVVFINFFPAKFDILRPKKTKFGADARPSIGWRLYPSDFDNVQGISGQASKKIAILDLIGAEKRQLIEFRSNLPPRPIPYQNALITTKPHTPYLNFLLW